MNLFQFTRLINSLKYPISNNSFIYCFSHHLQTIPYIAKDLQNKNIQTIYIIKNKTKMSGVDTYDTISEKYKEYNITTKFIPYTQSTINTKVESNVVIQWAIDNKIDELVIVAPPFHIIRALMTIISSSIELHSNIHIRSFIPSTFNLNETYITHQGLTCASINELILMEVERIEKYMEKGDIKAIEQIYNYLFTD